MDKVLSRGSVYGALIAGALVLSAPLFVNQQRFLLFHSAAELFIAVVACSVFVVAWNFRRYLDNSYLLFLGISFLFIGSLHLLHLLAYQGMDVFANRGADLPTQLWIASRYSLAIALLMAPFFLGRRLQAEPVFVAWGGAIALLLLSIFQWRIFPTCYVDGAEPSPLTPFKRISEVVIGLVFLMSVMLVCRKRRFFEPKVLRLIIAGVLLGLAAEIPFILYSHPYHWLNLMGHLLLIASFGCFYAALVKANIEKVYEAMTGERSPRQPSLVPNQPLYDPWLALTLRTVSRICSIIVMAIGVTVLAGWMWDVERLKTVLTNGITMKPNAAMGLVLAGLALWLLQIPGAGAPRHRLGRVLAILVASLGGLTLFEHLSGWNLGIDQILFSEPAGALATASPGRMGPPASTCMLLLGLSMTLMGVRGRRGRLTSQMLAVATGLLTMLPLIGYAYGAEELYGKAHLTGIAVHTAIALLLLAIGTLCARPDDELMGVVTANRGGGIMARRLLVAAILLPVALGWLRLWGEGSGLYDTQLGTAILSIVLVIVFMGVIWRNASSLNDLEAQREGARAERERTEAQMRETLQRLRMHVGNAPLAVLEWDADFRVTRWTGTAEAMFGWKSQEVLGRTIPDLRLIHEDDAPRVGGVMAGLLRGRQLHTITSNRNRRKDGSVVHCEWYNSALRDADGRIISVLSLALDVTERKGAQEQIEGLAEFPNEHPSPVMRVAHDGVLLYANHSSAAVLAEWACYAGRPVPADVCRLIRECLQSGHVLETDIEYGQRTYSFVFTPLPQKNYVNLYARDVTDHKRAEQALRDSEERFRSTFNQAAVGMALVGADGHWLMVNQKLSETLGYSRTELHQQTFAQTTHPEDLSLEMPRFRDLMAGRIGSYLIEKRCIHKDGRIVWVNANKSVLRDPKGQIGDCIAIIEDITARKQAQQEVRLLTETLERRVVQRTAELQEANRELESFSYSVSHDLRAPLRHIDGFAQLLSRHAGASLDTKGLHYLKTITDTVKHAGTLVDDLLAFSRMGRSEMRRSLVDVNRLVREVRVSLEPETAGRMIEWNLADLPAVPADPAMLRVVFQNLLANAVKFTRDRQPARIEVGSTCQDSEIIFHVRDNGVGFDMKYQDKLFGVFQRLHRSEQFEGTGIGLANVRRVVSRHGGRVWAESQLERGATFCFSLPRHQGEAKG